MAIESKLGRGPVGRPLGQPEEKKKSFGWLWIVIVIILIVAGGLWWYYSRPGNNAEINGPIGTGEYQAVFLDSGQVYFGKLETRDGDFYSLTNVFYLQSGAMDLDQPSNLSLVKLGNEAHGPEDKMKINKAHILFIEDMKGDSKVVQAIQDYKSKKK